MILTATGKDIDHERRLLMLADWLGSRKVRSTFVQERPGASGLLALWCEQVGRATTSEPATVAKPFAREKEPMRADVLEDILYNLVDNRNVRRAIAVHVGRAHGVEPAEILRQLMDLKEELQADRDAKPQIVVLQ